MIKLTTQEAIRSCREKVVKCQKAAGPLLYRHLPTRYFQGTEYLSTTYKLHYHTEPSLWSFRRKVDHFLHQLFNIEDGGTKNCLLYTASRTGDTVKVKGLPRRIKSIRTLHSLEALATYDYDAHPNIPRLTPEQKMATAIVDIMFLRCLFSLGREWSSDYFIDLSKAALPEGDVRVRIGEYNLLYDKIDKGWTIWMRS